MTILVKLQALNRQLPVIAQLKQMQITPSFSFLSSLLKLTRELVPRHTAWTANRWSREPRTAGKL